MDFIGNQTVQGPKDSFSAASKGFKRLQTMNKGPLKWTQWSPLYGENPGMFSSKTLISLNWTEERTEERKLKKERCGHLGWHGGE